MKHGLVCGAAFLAAVAVDDERALGEAVALRGEHRMAPGRVAAAATFARAGGLPPPEAR